MTTNVELNKKRSFFELIFEYSSFHSAPTSFFSFTANVLIATYVYIILMCLCLIMNQWPSVLHMWIEVCVFYAFFCWLHCKTMNDFAYFVRNNYMQYFTVWFFVQCAFRLYSLRQYRFNNRAVFIEGFFGSPLPLILYPQSMDFGQYSTNLQSKSPF